MDFWHQKEHRSTFINSLFPITHQHPNAFVIIIANKVLEMQHISVKEYSNRAIGNFKRAFSYTQLLYYTIFSII